MSHIGNKIRAGFFATPTRQGEYIKNLLNVLGDGNWLDPTCGEGDILYQLSSSFQSENCCISSYGVELDKARAERAKEKLTHCINAPIESMVISNNAFSLLFLNPPYDHSMKGMDEKDSSDRKEWVELQRNVRYLKEDGVMIYIIPSYRFADEKIARFLATHFYDIGVLRFSDEDYGDFRQCIFIGKKKRGKRKEFDAKLNAFLLSMTNEEFVMKKVTPINVIVGRKTWDVPADSSEVQTFYTKLENKSNFYEGIIHSKGFLAFKNRSKPRQLVIGGNPPLPVNQGQMALLLASGAINGEIGEGDNYHLVQGLEIVSKVREEEEKIHDSGSKTTVLKERTKRDVSVKIITPSGLIRKLV